MGRRSRFAKLVFLSLLLRDTIENLWSLCEMSSLAMRDELLGLFFKSWFLLLKKDFLVAT